MSLLRAVPDTPPRAVLYLRQSVHRDDSISMELQEIAGRDYCTKQGYEVIAVERDEGISGRTWSKRPAVQKAIDMIETQTADVIVLWKWSRLSRSRKDWALAADRVEVAGGRIESATEPIDTATASGRFARGVMTEYAAFQSEQIGEQWAEVRQKRFNQGLPPAGALPYGWVSKRTHIEPVEPEAGYVREMYRMYLAGHGMNSIARWLNSVGAKPRRGTTWIGASVRKILSSPIHAGYVIYRGEIRDGIHEGIISEQDWRAFLRKREERHIPTKIRRSDYLLSSLIVCHCGRKMYGRRWERNGRLNYAYKCPTATSHESQSRKMAAVNQAVTAWVKQLPYDIRATPGYQASQQVDKEALAREITAIEKQLVKLTEHLVSGLVPESTYRGTRDKLEARSRDLSSELAKLEAPALSKDVIVSGNESLIDSWDVLAVDAKRRILMQLVKHFTLNINKTLTVHTAWGETTVLDT